MTSDRKLKLSPNILNDIFFAYFYISFLYEKIEKYNMKIGFSRYLKKNN